MAARECLRRLLPQLRQAKKQASQAYSLTGCHQQARCYAVAGITQTSPSTLNEVMKLDLLAGKPAQEVADIWLEYHSQQGGPGRVGAVLSAADWELLQERGKKSPMFVLPLAKPNGGYVTLLTQQQLPVTLVTSLEEYRRYGTGAPACLTLTHYTELLDSVGLVLVRGDIVNDKLVSQAEARTVIELLRALYTDSEDYKLVLDFNHQPQAFDFSKLLQKMNIPTST